MTKLLNNKPEVINMPLGTHRISPLLPIPVIKYLTLQEELEQIKQRLLELENREKVMVFRDITREEAKKEIQQLFQSGRILYYSDIVKELKIDLETVVDICNELMESGAVEVDAKVR